GWKTLPKNSKVSAGQLALLGLVMARSYGTVAPACSGGDVLGVRVATGVLRMQVSARITSAGAASVFSQTSSMIPFISRPSASTPATQAVLTERNASWGGNALAKSASSVRNGLQSSIFQNASGSREQSPLGQNRGGGGGGGGTIAPGATAETSPSSINADHCAP